MTRENKNLLLQDLCARLPHKQKVCYKIRDNSEEITETLSGCLLDYFKTEKIAVVKPYLRPMSSMTDEERLIYEQRLHDVGRSIDVIDADDVVSHIDWLIKNKFDYRGLIPMGLALPAPEGMYD